MIELLFILDSSSDTKRALQIKEETPSSPGLCPSENQVPHQLNKA